jgi:hypothetical protein
MKKKSIFVALGVEKIRFRLWHADASVYLTST